MTLGATLGSVAETFAGDASHPDVWVMERAAPDFLALAAAGPTSPEERGRAASLSDDSARRALLARRAALRRVLAAYLRRGPETVRLVTGPGGKPALVPEHSDPYGLSFSAGHSGDLFCLAVGTSASLGLDVERVRPVPRALSIAVRWFSGAEAARFEKLSAGRQEDEFMRLWTGKEALAKRHGAGLRLMSGPDADLDVEAEAVGGRLTFFSPGEGYACALASSEAIEDVRVIRPEMVSWTT